MYETQFYEKFLINTLNTENDLLLFLEERSAADDENFFYCEREKSNRAVAQIEKFGLNKLFLKNFRILLSSNFYFLLYLPFL